MALIQCTKKLLAELSSSPDDLLSNPTFLGDWHANLFRIDRRKCVLFIHDEILFSVFVPMLTKPNFQNLASVFLDHLGKTLQSEGFGAIIKQIKNDYRDNLIYTKTSNRSVLGSMNDFIRCLSFILSRQGGLEMANSLDTNRALTRIPLVRKSFACAVEGLAEKLLSKETSNTVPNSLIS